MQQLKNSVRTFAEARDMFENSRKRRLALNTELVKTKEGYGIKLYDTIVVEYLDASRVRLNTGGWRTVTTFKRIAQFTSFNINSCGLTRATLPNGVVIDTRDLFIEYPKSDHYPRTFEYTQMGADFKPIKKHVVDSSRLSSECWSVQFRGFAACKSCEFKGTKDCGGQRIIETGENKHGVKIAQDKGV